VEICQRSVIKSAIGLSTWDTANVYSSGINEEIIGKAIKEFNIPRQKLTILAKCFGTVPEEASIFNWPFEAQMQKSKDYVNQGGEWLWQDSDHYP
jgi:aryl-alcohol dehydrogenase-like predicted oxidoreductase